MSRRRPYIRTFHFSIKITFKTSNVGARAPLFKAIRNRIAKLIKSAKLLAVAIKSFVGCWWLNILHRLAVIWTGSQGLVTIGVAVIVAHYLATLFNGVLLLGLPPGTMQVLVELIAVYLLKKQ